MAANELEPHLRVPDEDHRRPGGTSDATIESVALVSEALEWVERLRGRIRERLVGGRRHIYEAELKERRRTPSRRGHASRPPLGEMDEPGVS